MLPPGLRALAGAQGGAFTAGQARAHGVDVAPHRRAGRLVLLRKGVYAEREVLAAMTAAQVAAAQASARLLVTTGDLVASHATAAAIHGFRLFHQPPAEPQLTQAKRASTPAPAGDQRTEPRAACGRQRVTVADLPAAHRCTRYGVRVTSPERSVADCTRTLSPAAAVVTADSALRCGVSRQAVLDLLDAACHWPGVRQAREVMRFADARADSALESGTRWLLAQRGLPAPDLQITICDALGRDVGDVDFVWLAQRTILETDGRLKYLAQPGLRAHDNVLWREKLREDALRALGFEVVRGYWSDLADGCAGLAERVRAAFGLNAARAGLPDFGWHERHARRLQRAQ